MWHFDSDLSPVGLGGGWRSALRRAWNTDLWAGPVPVFKAAVTVAAAIVGSI